MADQELHYTFATWVFSLFVAGIEACDEEVATQCRAVADATEADTGNAAGEALVKRIADLVRNADPETVSAAARQLFGEHAASEMGDGDREARTHRVRRYQFSRGLPWLARIWERKSQGHVAPTWLLVERVTDQVSAMDPNPWNDIDEERVLPVQDFQVLWELDDCTSVHIR
jgi:hypothetical protein